MNRTLLPVLLALPIFAGCADTSATPSPGSAFHTALALPRLQHVTDAHYSEVPGRPECTAYAVTGTLDGAPRVADGVSCRQPDGSALVRERSPTGGPDLVETVPPPPMPAYAGGAGYDGAGYVGYGTDYAFGGPFGYGAFGDGLFGLDGFGFFGPAIFFGPVFVHHGYYGGRGGFHGGGFHGGGGHGGGGHGR